MGLVEMVMPKMGESVMEGTILKWLKDVGDPIEQDESVLEVATDKVDTEVPSTYNGTLSKILVREGDVVQVGHPIAMIEIEGDADIPVQEKGSESEAQKVLEVAEAPVAAGGYKASLQQSERFYSPLVLNIARTEQIPFEELERVPGTGKDNRVTKNDILNYLSNRKESSGTQPSATTTQTAPTPHVEIARTVSVNGADEIMEMDRMRKMIADRMVESKRISPHVSSFVEADVTNLVKWRNTKKDSFKQREGNSLTFTPLFVHAIVQAIKDFPMINVSVDGNKIIKKKDINIGIAVALPSGNLIVPVIKNADHYSLRGLALKVNDLANRARANKLQPDELQGGTYTVSNVGSFGNVMGTPIIMQPQVAIMAVGAIRKKPAVIETPEGDLIGIRQLMYLSHSYDHRIVDGSLGGMFVRKVADYLEQFDMTTEI
ncbi:dihydrolipoamide acetyltransferase family protein [Rapidithrix thailandica]|uniref:Dihydrolipoamide acetyltransferase component of pyruvate dehydrogenase complex n=1 Tax=Rapidithrix thailandica TaxID=413964 RepID=A0AAW9RXM1_9BACT